MFTYEVKDDGDAESAGRDGVGEPRGSLPSTKDPVSSSANW